MKTTLSGQHDVAVEIRLTYKCPGTLFENRLRFCFLKGLHGEVVFSTVGFLQEGTWSKSPSWGLSGLFVSCPMAAGMDSLPVALRWTEWVYKMDEWICFLKYKYGCFKKKKQPRNASAACLFKATFVCCFSFICQKNTVLYREVK